MRFRNKISFGQNYFSSLKLTDPVHNPLHTFTHHYNDH